MSYALVVSEVRKGILDERNLDAIGFAQLAGKEVCFLMPDNTGLLGDTPVDSILGLKAGEEVLLNPLSFVALLDAIFASTGKPDFLVFTHSSSGTELASYTAGYFGFPIVTDVSGYDRETGKLSKSYYSDKVFGEFSRVGDAPLVVTVRSGSFREHVKAGAATGNVDVIDAPPETSGRSFIEYVEEEKTDVDITKADFLVSLGRGIGSKDEIPAYEELVGRLRGTLSCSRPVVDKLWLPKARQVGTSGKTVKPKVYLSLGISGAFQHIAGMKDADCIIAVNKDPEAPIFQYAHYGLVGDAQKVRDCLMESLKG